jgi:hypothetical protein
VTGEEAIVVSFKGISQYFLEELRRRKAFSFWVLCSGQARN